VLFSTEQRDEYGVPEEKQEVISVDPPPNSIFPQPEIKIPYLSHEPMTEEELDKLYVYRCKECGSKIRQFRILWQLHYKLKHREAFNFVKERKNGLHL
jgi:hypothetical protein